MPLTITRFTTDAQLTSMFTLFNTKVPAVTGTSIVDEFNADFGTTVPMTLAFWHPLLADPKSRIFGGFQPANTLRGAGWWQQDAGGAWGFRLVGIDKSLTDALRLSGFHDFVIERAAAVPADTRFYGLVKIGGKLDTYMQPRLTSRTLQGSMALYQTTAAEMIARL